MSDLKTHYKNLSPDSIGFASDEATGELVCDGKEISSFWQDLVKQKGITRRPACVLYSTTQIWHNFERLGQTFPDQLRTGSQHSGYYRLGHNSAPVVYERVSRIFLLENRINALTTELLEPKHLALVEQLLPSAHLHTCVLDGTTKFSQQDLLQALAGNSVCV